MVAERALQFQGIGGEGVGGLDGAAARPKKLFCVCLRKR